MNDIILSINSTDLDNAWQWISSGQETVGRVSADGCFMVMAGIRGIDEPKELKNVLHRCV